MKKKFCSDLVPSLEGFLAWRLENRFGADSVSAPDVLLYHDQTRFHLDDVRKVSMIYEEIIVLYVYLKFLEAYDKF